MNSFFMNDPHRRFACDLRPIEVSTADFTLLPPLTVQMPPQTAGSLDSSRNGDFAGPIFRSF